jgi:hypothetical protein
LRGLSFCRSLILCQHMYEGRLRAESKHLHMVDVKSKTRCCSSAVKDKVPQKIVLAFSALLSEIKFCRN